MGISRGPRVSWVIGMCSWAVGLAPAVGQPPTSSATPPTGTPQQITLHLTGALPTAHPDLGDELELHLVRDGSPWGGGGAQARWQRGVVGSSALFKPGQQGHRPASLYSWVEADGELTAVEEDGDGLTLTVKLTISPDPWVAGGRAEYRLRLRRTNGGLHGQVEGSFERDAEGRAGPAGRQSVHGTVRGTITSEPWPAALPGMVPVAPGEHPRLLFRKGDVPALRARMASAEGQAILARLRQQLANESPRAQLEHGYGFGLMYQLTGDVAWAQRARAYVEGVIAGRITAARFAWRPREGGGGRIIPAVAAVAVTYDLCYDGWPPEFRAWVASSLQDALYPRLVLTPTAEEAEQFFNPRTSHYMVWQGGAGLGTLAILGDPGVDEAAVRRSDRILALRLKRALSVGFGDRAWFHEGTFPGRYATTEGLLPYLQARRVALGEDFVGPSPAAQWLTTKWLFEVVRGGGRLQCFQRQRFANVAWTELRGDLALGFGVMPEAHKPAALWFYERVCEPGTARTYDADSPREAVYAFVNWPVGVAPRDPAEVLGHVLRDEDGRFQVFRNGWRGEGDVAVSLWRECAMVGLGQVVRGFPGAVPYEARVTSVQTQPDGTSVIQALAPSSSGATTRYAMAIDFSTVSGASALLVGVADGNGASPVAVSVASECPPEWSASLKVGQVRSATKPGAGAQVVRAGGVTFHVQTLQSGPPPVAEAVAASATPQIRVGRRLVSYVDGTLVLGEAP